MYKQEQNKIGNQIGSHQKQFNNKKKESIKYDIKE